MSVMPVRRSLLKLPDDCSLGLSSPKPLYRRGTANDDICLVSALKVLEKRPLLSNTPKSFLAEVCAICQDPFKPLSEESEEVQLCATRCHHYFHKECFQDLQKSGAETCYKCPNCKTFLRESEFASFNNYQAVRLPKSFKRAIDSGNLVYLQKLFLDDLAISDESRGWGVLRAAEMGRQDIVEFLLADGSISEQHCAGAAAAASRNGHRDIVELLLARLDLSDGELRDKAVLGAAAYGDKAMVERFLEYGPISSLCFSGSFKTALENGHGELVKLFLEQDTFAVEDYYDFTFVHHVAQSSIDVVEALLQTNTIPERLFGRVLAKFACEGRKDIVELLLDSYVFSEAERGLGLSMTVLKGHKDIVQLLLANGPISEEIRGKALCVAVGRGDGKDTVELLLANGPISEKARDDAVHEAALQGNKEIAQLLLANGSISEICFSGSFKAALENGHGELVKLFLEQDTFAVEDYYDFTFVHHVAQSSIDVVEALLQTNTIPERLFGRVLAKFACEGRKDIVELLLDSYVFSEAERGLGLSMTVLKGHKDIVQLLLANGPISEEIRGKALCVAVGRGDGKDTVELLLANGSISEKARDDAVHEAALQGNKEIAQLLLANGSISEICFAHSFAFVLQNGYKDLVQLFLEYGYGSCIARCYNESAFIRHIALSSIDIVEMLLRFNAVPEKFFGDLLATTAGEGRKDTVELLLDYRFLSEEIRGKAVRWAAGHKDIVRLLLTNGPISETDRSWAVYDAVLSEGDKGAVQLLLEDGPILERCRGFSVCEATRTGDTDTVRLLLANGTISDSHFSSSFQSALEKGHEALIKLLLEHGSFIVKESYHSDFIRFVAQSPEGVVKALLTSGTIPERLFGSLLADSASKNRKDIIELLLDSYGFSELERSWAVNAAVYKDNKDIVQLLLANSPISEADRGFAVDLAAQKGATATLELLLANGPISEVDRSAAVASSAALGHKDIVQLLLTNGSIQENLRGLAVSCAAERGHKDIVQLLLDNGPIAYSDFASAFKAALEKGHGEIVKLLLEHGSFVVEETYDSDFIRVVAQSPVDVVEALLTSGTIPERLFGKLLEASAIRGGEEGEEIVKLLLDYCNFSTADRLP